MKILPYSMTNYQLRNQTLPEFETKTLGMECISFSLLMFQRGEFIPYYRENQPCYGELRKYAESYTWNPDNTWSWKKFWSPKEVTQTTPVQKPTDLCHPFPDGEPVLVGFGGDMFEWMSNHKEFTDFVFSERSPWYSVLKTAKRFTNGFIIHDTDIDPTVLVNFVNSVRGFQITEWNRCRELGMTDHQALVWCFGWENTNLNGLVNYYFPQKIDLPRFEAGTPLDLTGGTLRDRYDYNRKDLHKIYHSKDGWNYQKFQKKLVGYDDDSWAFSRMIDADLAKGFISEYDSEKKRMTLMIEAEKVEVEVKEIAA